MVVTIRAHYDGKVIVPDDAVDLPINQPLCFQVIETADQEASADVETEERRRNSALERLACRAVHGLTISTEALRREYLYED